MEHPNIPDSVRENAENYIRHAVNRGLAEAFAAGYEAGANQTLKRIMAAASEVTTPSLTATLPPVRHRLRPQGLAPREVHPNSAEARRFPYGAVTAAFRQALKASGVFGVRHDDLIAMVSEILGEDVGDMDHRDTIKRLKKAGEARMHEGRYFAGPQLRNENGAPATLPLSAPEDGTAIPPDHQPPTHDL